MGMRNQLFQRSGYESPAMQPELAQEFLQQVRKLVHKLFAPTGQSAPTSVIFCGTDRASGSSSVCCRTAELLAAQVPGTVCVVDANLTAPSLHRHFQIENRRGFSDALVRSDVKSDVKSDAKSEVKSDSMQGFAQQIRGSNLWVVTSGTALDVSLAAYSERLQSQILTLRTLFDYVLIDVAAVSRSSNAVMLGRLVDGAVLVIETKSATRAAARQAKEILKASNVPIFGAVLNKWTSSGPVKDDVASAPAQHTQPVASKVRRAPAKFPAEKNGSPNRSIPRIPQEAARIEPSKSDTPKSSPGTNGDAVVRAGSVQPIAPKVRPAGAVVRATRLEITKKRAKRRLWNRFARPVAAPPVERVRSIAKESVREAAARQAPKNDAGRQAAKQGAWNKPATPPAKETLPDEIAASIALGGASKEPPKPQQPLSPRAKKPATDEPTPVSAKAAARNGRAAWFPRSSPPQPTASSIPKLFGAVTWTIVVGGTLWFLHGRSLFIPNRPEVRATLPALVSNPLGLKVDRTGGMLDIVWDRNSSTAMNSKGGVVTIHDGGIEKRIVLDPGEIRSGHIYYGPRSADLDVRLEVAVENGGTASESVLVVGAPAAQL
jgi:Mrp family chromosome partitioning ATPase